MDRSKMLVVVDMQNDFIDGSLGSCEARAIVDKVCQKIENWDGYVCFTMDTHYDNYLETIEGTHIPIEHCINETHGWELNDKVADYKTDRAFTYYKDSFGAMNLLEMVEYMGVNDVQIIGVCTDICVISNALLLRSAAPYITITVDASCCAGTSPENHRAALTIMKQCCIDIVNE